MGGGQPAPGGSSLALTITGSDQKEPEHDGFWLNRPTHELGHLGRGLSTSRTCRKSPAPQPSKSELRLSRPRDERG
jgi:hypothetical protein